MSISKEITIGTLARQAGCTVPTVRYYEEIGLFPEAKRQASGHRVYGEAALRRLTFIRRCRDFGFSIEQVKQLATLVSSPNSDCTTARDLAQAHLDGVRRKLKEMRSLERSLKDFVSECNAKCAGGPARACVILEDLASAKPTPCCSPDASRSIKSVGKC